MAEKLCALKKKGGGKLSETTLWTNSTPTSSFPNSDITLNNNLSEYDSIRIYYRVSTSNNKTTFVDVSESDFIEMVGIDGTLKVGISCFDGGTTYLRALNYIDNYTVHFNSAGQLGVTTLSNTKCIPVKICGLN